MSHGWMLIVLVLTGAAGCSNSSIPPVPPPPGTEAPVLPGTGDFAHQPFKAPLSVEDAELILLRTDVFEFGGMPPKRQVQAFNLLLDQPDAMKRFETVAERGRPAGKLYALCAFSTLSAARAAKMSSELGKGDAEILVIDSDLIFRMKGPDAAAFIQHRQLWLEMRAKKQETAAYFNKVG